MTETLLSFSHLSIVLSIERVKFVPTVYLDNLVCDPPHMLPVFGGVCLRAAR